MRQSSQFTYVTWLVIAAGVLTLAAGCGEGQTPPEASDPEKALAALTKTLESWKTGGLPSALGEQAPPIHVADEDWLIGFRLQEYRSAGDHRLIGHTVHCPVVLTLKDRKGRSIWKKVAYQVTTEPSLSVVRQETQ